MASAAQALVASGKITSSQGILMRLSGMPLGTLDNGKFEPLTAAQKQSYGNTPVNYIQLFQNNMEGLPQSDPNYANDQAILSAMEGAQGSVSSVNITA